MDELYVRIGGQKIWPWRAVDDEGEVLDVLVQKRRNKDAALKLIGKLLRNQVVHPEISTTDKLRSYAAALHELGLKGAHRPGGLRVSNRARIHTWQSGDGNGSSRSSSPRAQRRGSSPPTS